MSRDQLLAPCDHDHARAADHGQAEVSGELGGSAVIDQQCGSDGPRQRDRRSFACTEPVEWIRLLGPAGSGTGREPGRRAPYRDRAAVGIGGRSPAAGVPYQLVILGFGVGRLVRQRAYETPSGFVTRTPRPPAERCRT